MLNLSQLTRNGAELIRKYPSLLTEDELHSTKEAICQELAQRETRESKEFDADERIAA